ncbi:MAG: hypothetical protein ACJAXY_000038 [Nonlabens sp.]|jgi:hypothetical protein|uniref:hypothetical protein n=1 Tax=Nonlabens sp. TaxID=1888209 RepID=UPI0039E43B73
MKGIPNIAKKTKFGSLQENKLMEINKRVLNTSLHYFQINKDNKMKCAVSSSPAIENKDSNYRNALALYFENRSVDRFLLSCSKKFSCKTSANQIIVL